MMESLIDWFEQIGPVKAALIATLFTWGLTAAGASLVFFFKSMPRKFFDGMLGFTGGVMVAASFWSLLSPAIDMSEGDGFSKVLPAAIGFGLGAVFIYFLDKFSISIFSLSLWLQNLSHRDFNLLFNSLLFL